jgi:putative addiction module killer protein
MIYQAIETEVFGKWRDGLCDTTAQTKIRVRITRAMTGNFGDWKTESGEVRAMRIDYGPGYRLYYIIRDNKIIFLLCGGTKGKQQADIRRAEALASEV